MFKKIIAYFLVIQQINLGVLSASPGDLSIAFERDLSRSNHVNLKIFDDQNVTFDEDILVNLNGRQFDLGAVFGAKYGNFSVVRGLYDESIQIKSDQKDNQFSFHIYPDGRVKLGGCSLSHLLKIDSFGAFSLTKEVRGEGIDLSGFSIFNKSKIDTKSLKLEARGGQIINSIEGEIFVRTMMISGSDLVNNGRVRGVNGGFLDLGGHSFLNLYTAQIKKNHAFQTEISWDGNFKVQNFNEFRNEATMRSDSVNLKKVKDSKKLDNSALILEGGLFNNLGNILSNGNILGLVKEGYNGIEKTIKLMGRFLFKADGGSFINDGSIDADLGSEIESTDLIRNTLTILSGGSDVKLKAPELQLESGGIKAESGDVFLKCEFGESKGEISCGRNGFLDVSEIFHLSGPTLSGGNFLFSGPGEVVGNNKIQSNGDAIFFASFKNQSDLVVSGNLVLMNSAKSFWNQNGANANVSKRIFIQNSGSFINDGHVQMLGGDLNCIGKFANNGKMLASGDGVLLNLNGGENKGQIASDVCVLLNTDLSFDNYGSIASPEVTCMGDGILVNHKESQFFAKNHMRSEGLTIENHGILGSSKKSEFNSKLDNWGTVKGDDELNIAQGTSHETGQLISNNMKFLESFLNKGEILVNSFKDSLNLNIEGFLANSGLISALKPIKLSGNGFLENSGILLTKSHVLSESSLGIHNQDSGEIVSSDNTILSLDSLTNDGKITSGGITKINATKTVINNHNISSEGEVDIDTQSFVNNKTIESKKAVEINTYGFAGSGELTAPVVKVTTIASPTNSITAYDTADITVSEPWSLNGANLDIHNFKLNGRLTDLEDPSFSLQISGDFDWTAPGAVLLKATMDITGKSRWIHPKGTTSNGVFYGRGGMDYDGAFIINNQLFHTGNDSKFDLVGDWRNFGFAYFTGALTINSKSGGILVESPDPFNTSKPAIFFQEGSNSKVSFNLHGSFRNKSATAIMEGVMDHHFQTLINEMAPPRVKGSWNVAYSSGYKGRDTAHRTFIIREASMEPITSFNHGCFDVTSMINNGGLFSWKNRMDFKWLNFKNLNQTVINTGWHRYCEVIGRRHRKDVFHIIPRDTIASTHVARFLCGGELDLDLNGAKYNSDQLGQIPPSANFQNTGQLNARVLNLNVPQVGSGHLTGINPKTRTIPSKISFSGFGNILESYGALERAPSSSPYAMVSKLTHGKPPSEAEIELQLSPDLYEKYLEEQRESEVFANWLTYHWNTSGRGNLPSVEERQSIISSIKLQAGWEMDPKNLHKITPLNLKTIAPRIATLGKTSGDERQKFDPYTMSMVLQKTLLEYTGKSSLSNNNNNSLLEVRKLEESGYLEGRRLHNQLPELVPHNWDEMSHKEKLAHQLRVMISDAELESFVNPAIVYEVVEEFGEKILAPNLHIPSTMREMLTKCVGRSFASQYNLKTTGNMDLGGTMVAQKGMDAKSESNMQTGNVYTNSDINLEAQNRYHTGEAVSKEGNIKDTAQNLMHLKGGSHEGESVELNADNAFVEPEVKSVAYNGGYTHVVVNRSSALSRNKPYRANFKSSSALFAYKIQGKGVDLNLGKQSHVGAQDLHKTQDFMAGKRTRVQTHDVTNLYTEIENTDKDSSLNITGGVATFAGTLLKSAKDTITKFTSFKEEAVTDTHEETIEHRGKKKAFRGRKITSSSHSVAQERGNIYQNNNGGKTTIYFKENAEMHAPESHDKIEINSEHGNVMFKLLKRQESRSFSKSKKGTFWQSSKNKGSTSTNYSHPKTEKIEVKTKGQVNIPITNKMSIDIDKDIGVKWINSLKNNNNVNFYLLPELYDHWRKKKQGLTAVAAITLSLAIGIATYGAGAAIIETGGALGAMANAGISTLASNAGVSLVNNKGNIGRVFKEMGKTENIQNIAISVATAGLTYGICDKLKIPTETKDFIDIAQKNGVNLAASTVANSAIKAENPFKNLAENGGTILANIAAEWGADKLGKFGENSRKAENPKNLELNPELKSATKLGYVEHKIGHAALGAGSGIVSKLLEGKSFKSAIKTGALAGFFAGSMAEVTAESLPQDWSPETRGNIAKLATTASSAFTGFDPEITKSVAVNAIEHNFMDHPSPYPQVEQNRNEMLREGTDQIWEFGKEEIPELVEFSDRVHQEIDNLHDWKDKFPVINYGMNIVSGGFPILHVLQNRDVHHNVADLVLPKNKLDVGLFAASGVGKVVGGGIKGVSLAATAISKTSKASSSTSTVMKNAVKVAEKKTPSFMKSTSSSSARAVEKKPKNVVDSSSFSKDSKITPLERKGMVKFDDVEFRAVRDLGHMKEEDLFRMVKTGKSPYDKNGMRLEGHHHNQQYHRDEGAFIVEIPYKNHNISNVNQHPNSNIKGGGLTVNERKDWDKLRKQFNKERAKEELKKRGFHDEK